MFLDWDNDKQRDLGELAMLPTAKASTSSYNLPAPQSYVVRIEVQGNFTQYPSPPTSTMAPIAFCSAPANRRGGLDFAAAAGTGTQGVGNDGVLKGKVVDDLGNARAGVTVFIDKNSTAFSTLPRPAC